MSVELRERKWCGVLGIEKVSVKGYWKEITNAHGLREISTWQEKLSLKLSLYFRIRPP